MHIVHILTLYVLGRHIKNSFYHATKIFQNCRSRTFQFSWESRLLAPCPTTYKKNHELLLNGYRPRRKDSTCSLQYARKPNEAISRHARSIEYPLPMSIQELRHSIISAQYVVVHNCPLSLLNLSVQHTNKEEPQRLLVQIITIRGLIGIHYQPGTTHQ